MTLKNYLSEVSIMVAGKLKIVSQNDAFMISAARNIQYVLKACVLDIFAKNIFDIYLNNIIIMSSLNLACKCLGEH